MSGPRTTVTIDRVVLHGVDPGQVRAIVEGLQAEFATVFADAGARRQLGSSRPAAAIRLGSMPLGLGRAGARRFGAAVAQAAARGMRK
jgi:hypothetical protein